MRQLMAFLFLCMTTSMLFAGEPVPVWELTPDTLKEAPTVGEISLVDGAVSLDGTNTFTLPKDILGDQRDFTIEFEVTRPKNATRGNSLTLVSNTDDGTKAGLKLRYHPPSYNCGWLYTNGSMTVEKRGFLTDKPKKITIVSQSSQLMMFRDGMLLASTGEVKASAQPLTFGAIEKKPTLPYLLKSIKVYNTPIIPSGFDETAERMRSYSGDEYFMQRVELKDPSLPRMLIIGDSISGGYRGHVTTLLKGKANVDYWMIGYKYMGGKNSPMERALTGVLSNGPYDVVTFNFGLHYWGKPERSPEDKHIPWMTKLVDHVKAVSPTTTFAWIRTTPWRTTPDTGRPTLKTKQNDRIIRFNTMTDSLMRQKGLLIVDLYTLAESQLHTRPEGSKDSVHWSREVSKLFAQEIVNTVKPYLKKTPTAKTTPVGQKLKVAQCWDDSLTTDIPLVALLKKHGAKATFNIIPRKERRAFVVKKKNDKPGTPFSFMPRGTTGGFTVEHLATSEMPAIYKGFTVAAHCGFPLADTPKAAATRKRTLDRTMALIKNNFGQQRVGFVYPGGGYTPAAMKSVRKAGYLYARTTKSAPAPLPLDTPMAQPSSCHWSTHNFWKRYEAAKAKGGIFYFWGHSCELGNDPVLWERLGTIYEKISADPDAEWVDVVDLF